MNRPDPMLGLVSFLFPGFGQYLQRRMSAAVAFALAAVAVWVGPSLFLAFHFMVLDQTDAATQVDFVRTLRPLTYLLRFVVHAAAAYDATHLLLPLRRPRGQTARPAATHAPREAAGHSARAARRTAVRR